MAAPIYIEHYNGIGGDASEVSLLWAWLEKTDTNSGGFDVFLTCPG